MCAVRAQSVQNQQRVRCKFRIRQAHGDADPGLEWRDHAMRRGVLGDILMKRAARAQTRRCIDR